MVDTDNTDTNDFYLPGASSLIYNIDKRIMLILRDGRHLVGVLRSFDQFMNLILEDACERVIISGDFNIFYSYTPSTTKSLRQIWGYPTRCIYRSGWEHNTPRRIRSWVGGTDDIAEGGTRGATSGGKLRAPNGITWVGFWINHFESNLI